MAIVVEHEKRKHIILQKSLDVFVEEGYEDATFQKIADKCAITRTTLYIYFKNKHDIFLGSIKELFIDLETDLTAILKDESLSAEQSLRQILMKIVDYCEANTKLFQVVLNYLLQLRKTGVDTNEKVRRRVVRLKHLLNTVMIRGIRSGEFKDFNIKEMNALIYDIIEAGVFHLIILNQTDISDVRATLNTAVDNFIVK